MFPKPRWIPRRSGLFLGACVSLALLSVSPLEAGVFPYPSHTERLDNGLTLILVPMQAEGLVSFWTVVRTGARDEVEAGRTGFAHFFEHMMFRGTERYPAEVYNAKLASIGADSNASTWDDFTSYQNSIAKEDLELLVDLESDRFQRLSYLEPEFRTEAGAVYGEYRKNRSSPFFALRESVRAKAFEKHTYGHTAMGFEADIQAMPTLYEYSKTFFQRFYRPENTVVLVSGDLEVKPTVELLKRYYGTWKGGFAPPSVPAEPTQTAERRIEVPFPGRALPTLWLAYKAPAFDARDRRGVALTLAADLLFGETSELYGTLVLGEQRLQNLQASTPDSRDPGLFDVIATVRDANDLEGARIAIDEAIAAFAAKPVAADRLAALKSRLKYSFLMELDTPDAVARALVRMIALTGGIAAVDELYATVETITPEDVQAAVREVLVPERRTIGILRGDAR